MKQRAVVSLVLTLITCAPLAASEKLEPIPNRLVVLTFDDSVKSHFTVAGPILKKYGFGATFFITEGFTFKTNKKDYMTWEEIRQLHDDGFEIGNHTRDHMGVNPSNLDKLKEQLQAIDDQCKKHGIPKPTSFAWPGNSITDKAFPILQEHGINFARRGGSPEHDYDPGRGYAYQPGEDHPLLIPSAGDARPKWKMKDFVDAVLQAKQGRVAVLQFHGVPEGEHPWVHTPQEQFEKYMRYLYLNKCKVIAVRDLAKYVDTTQTIDNPWAIVRKRQQEFQDQLAIANKLRHANQHAEEIERQCEETCRPQRRRRLFEIFKPLRQRLFRRCR